MARKKAKYKKRTVRRSRSIVARKPSVKRRSRSGRVRNNSSIGIGENLINAIIGIGSYAVGSYASTMADDKFMKTLLASAGAGLAFVMPKNSNAIYTGAILSALITGLSNFLSDEDKAKADFLKKAHLVMSGDGEIVITPQQAEILQYAYKKALSGENNDSPLSGSKEYVMSKNDYSLSGFSNSSPLA